MYNRYVMCRYADKGCLLIQDAPLIGDAIVEYDFEIGAYDRTKQFGMVFMTFQIAVHGANMGPTWVLSASDGPHVGPKNLAIKDDCIRDDDFISLQRPRSLTLVNETVRY